MSLLTVSGLNKHFGGLAAVAHMDFSVEHGQILAIIGPNGAGKSTVMKVIFGLLAPWRGSVSFAGDEISGLSPDRIVRRGMCLVPQVDNVFPSLTVEENLEMGAFVLTGPIREQKERIFEMFPRLAERRRQRAGKMSGGERQMVAMGRAMMLEPKMLLLDEPSAGLAPLVVDSIFETVREVAQSGVAILMVEQNARKSLELADRGYVLANGSNQVDGTGSDLLDNPEVARLYLGG